MRIVARTLLLTFAVFLLNSVESRPTDPEGNNNNNLPPNIPPRARPRNGVHPLYVKNPLTHSLELRSVQVTSLGSGRFNFHFGRAPLEPRGPTDQPPRPQGGQGPPQNPLEPRGPTGQAPRPQGGQGPTQNPLEASGPTGQSPRPEGGQGPPQNPLEPRGPTGESPRPQGGQGPPQNP